MRMDTTETELRALYQLVGTYLENGALAAALEAAVRLTGAIEDRRVELESQVVSDIAELFYAKTQVAHV